MYLSRVALLAITTSLAPLVAQGQQSGWQKNQVNATMCTWTALRAATLKDTVYMDGGYLKWVPGMSDGSYGAPTQDNNPLGLMYTLNFSRPFNLTSNISEILGTISKAPNGGGANNLAPNYFDGAMLANDHELYLYGGLLTKTDVFQAPDEDENIGYRVSQYGVPKGSFFEGFFKKDLPTGLTRYLAFGGAANAPSENKAWYFGGMRSPSWGPIYYPTINNTINPLNVSNTLITLDMGTQQDETWKNVTLPSAIKGRASPDLVWVPVGSQGILVALGGVTFPDFTTGSLTSLNEPQSKIDSPVFMSTIDIYDVANNKWYQQSTVDGPGQLAKGCAVVAHAQDFSSYNIYYYGGYDGLHSTSDFNDDVWVLSLPSFTWTRVSTGTADHARAGHKCVMPYPDQMMVIGGFASLKGAGNPKCVKDGVVQVFNLTAGSWMQSYDPTKWSPYGVPESIQTKIGGSAKGGATVMTPTPSGWADPSLASVFATPYPTSKLTPYYPYPLESSNNNTRTDLSGGGGSGLQPWVAPVLGVVLGLVLITAIVVGVLLYRRRKLLRANPGSSEGATDENGHRILSWIRGQDPGSNKAMTVTSEATPVNPDDVDSRVASTRPEMSQTRGSYYTAAEMPDTPLVELQDTSPRAELGDTGLTPIDIINKHSHFARTPQSETAPSHPSSLAQYSISHENASVSSNSQHRGPPSSIGGPRPDSPALPANFAGTAAAATSPNAAAPTSAARMVSGVSGISERDQAHLRQISDVSVSSTGSAPQSEPVEPGVTSPVPVSAIPGSGTMGPVSPPLPVSPPTGEERDAPDYISAGSRGAGPVNSPLRRSVFYESAEDLGEKRSGPQH